LPFGESQIIEADQQNEIVETEELSYSRKKKKKEHQVPVRAVLHWHLPRIEEIIEPANRQKDDRKIGYL